MRAARGGNRISAVGFLAFLIGFAFAITQLVRLEHEVAEKKRELISTTAQLAQLRQEKSALEDERKRLQKENQDLRQQKQELKKANQAMEEATRLQMNRQYEESLKKLAIVLRNDPENEVAYCYYALSCYHMGRYRESVTNALRSLQIAPDYFDPNVPLICSLNKLSRQEEAAQFLRKTLDSSIESELTLVSRKRYYDEIWRDKKMRSVLIAHQNKVKTLQTRLKNLGYYSSYECVIDGMIGRNTLFAIQKFTQAARMTNNISVDSLLIATEGAPRVKLALQRN